MSRKVTSKAKSRKNSIKKKKTRSRTMKAGMFQAMKEKAAAELKIKQESDKFAGKGIPYTDVLPFDRVIKKTITVLVFGPGVGSKRSVLEEMKKSDSRFKIEFLDAPEGEAYCSDEAVSNYLNTHHHPHVIIAGSRSTETVKKILENKLETMVENEYHLLKRPYTNGVLLLGPEKHFRNVCDNAPHDTRYVVVYGTADPHMGIQYVRWGVLLSKQHELIEMEGFGHDLTNKDVPNPWNGGDLMASLIYRAKIDRSPSNKSKSK